MKTEVEAEGGVRSRCEDAQKDAESAEAQRAWSLADRVNGHPERVDQVLPELAELLQRTWDTGDDDGLDAVVHALGLADDVRAAVLLLPLARAGHRDPTVRQSLARALAGGGDGEPTRTEVIAALLPMTADLVADVRDWACFSLGLLDADDEACRDALAARLDDEHFDTRCEAMRALAQTGDPRALAATAAALAGDDQDVSLLQLEAAAALADPVLLPALAALRQTWSDDEDEFTEAVDVAMRRCQPAAAAAARRVEEDLQRASRDLQERHQPCGTLRGSWPRTVVVDLDGDGRPVVGHVPSRLWWADDDPTRAVSTQLLFTFIERTPAPGEADASS